MDIKFGTGGWRGIIDKEFTKTNMWRVLNAIAQYSEKYFPNNKKILIGYDNRKYSDCHSKSACGVFNAFGFDTTIYDFSVTTPMVMYAARSKKYPIAIMFTASHNPAEYNGIKVFIEGRDASKEITDKLEEFSNHVKYFKPNRRGKCTYGSSTVAAKKFVKNIYKNINKQCIRKSNLNVLCDFMCGTASLPYKKLEKQLKISSDYLNDFVDTNFNGIAPCPTANNTTALQQIIKDKPFDKHYDVGFAFDGDGDRLGVVDEKGNYIDGNDLISLITWYLYEYKNMDKDIAASCCTTSRLETIACCYKHKCIYTPIGIKYLMSEIDKNDLDFAGEQNGGLIFKNHTYGKDSIYTAALILEMLATLQINLSDLIYNMKLLFGDHYYSDIALKYIGDKNTLAMLIVDKNKVPTFNRKIKDVDYTDGCKITFADDGFVSYRLSGTEPLLRILIDAKKPDDIDNYTEVIKEFFKEYIVS